MADITHDFKHIKKQKIKIAKELCYANEVIERLKNCNDIYELERIMTYARYNLIERTYKNE